MAIFLKRPSLSKIIVTKDNKWTSSIHDKEIGVIVVTTEKEQQEKEKKVREVT